MKIVRNKRPETKLHYKNKKIIKIAVITLKDIEYVGQNTKHG